MLKQDITQQANDYRENKAAVLLAKKLNKPKLTDKLKKFYIPIQTFNTILMFITLALQIIFSNELLHLILCSILSATSIFLFFLSKKRGETTKSHIAIGIIWGVNVLMSLIRLIC